MATRTTTTVAATAVVTPLKTRSPVWPPPAAFWSVRRRDVDLRAQSFTGPSAEVCTDSGRGA